MKKLLLMICAVLTAGVMAAQPPFGGPPPGFPGAPGGPAGGGDKKVDNAKRYEYVKMGLKMDDKAFEKFLPLYMAYQREIRNIDKDLKKYVDSFKEEDEVSKKVARKVAMARLNAQMDTARAKKEHLRAFMPYLTPDQILKVFSLERRGGKRGDKGGRPEGAPPAGFPGAFPGGTPPPPPAGAPVPPVQ